MKFGFYPYKTRFEGANFLIEVVQDFDDIIGNGVDDRVWNGWWYPPLDWKDKKSLRGSELMKGTEQILLPLDGFVLPSTHEFLHKSSQSKRRIEFLIIAFGFVCGMRTIPEGWQHLSRIPIRRHEISDLVLRDREVALILDGYDELYNQLGEKKIRYLHSAINAYQWANYTEHWFEKFSYLCMSFDALTNVYDEVFKNDWRSKNTKGKKNGQWSYARDLCKYLGTPTPYWARKYKRNGWYTCKFYMSRNDIVHEAKIGSQPLGLVIDHAFFDMMLDLQHLITRAVIYLSRVNCEYTSSAINHRQMCGLGIYK